MPEQKKGETSAYVEVDDREKAPNAEQKKWEEEHLALGRHLTWILIKTFSRASMKSELPTSQLVMMIHRAI